MLRSLQAAKKKTRVQCYLSSSSDDLVITANCSALPILHIKELQVFKVHNFLLYWKRSFCFRFKTYQIRQTKKQCNEGKKDVCFWDNGKLKYKSWKRRKMCLCSIYTLPAVFKPLLQNCFLSWLVVNRSLIHSSLSFCEFFL